MRQSIIHYSWTYLNLSETFIYNFLTNIKKYDVYVLTRQLKNLDKFPYKDIFLCKKPIRFSWRWFIYNLSGHIVGEYSLNRYCEKIIRDTGSKLIHAHFGPRGWEVLKVKKKLKIPLVTSFYDCDLSVYAKQRIWQERYSHLFREGEGFLVEGSVMKKRLVDLGCPEDKVRLIHISVDLSRYNFRERRRNGGDEKTIFLFCGRFVEKKGIIYALEAIRRVKQDYPDIEFRLIGDGELRSEIEDFIKKHDMGEYVKLLGVLPHSEVIKEMDKADIFIHPSVTASDGDTEGGAPTILIEAQAMGMPVISTYHCDIPEVVVDGKSALLSPERDVDSLTDNINRILSGSVDWMEMGRVGRAHVEKDYNIKKEISKLEDIYAKLIQGKRIE